ncbi:MAG: xanthine dehydrogenase family protein subunit M [Candidatus Omnitrophota bacterium]|jgi:xanthine dehydrogenase YagS FAD-binding subunit|nr:MAG: xanthine dehydrogenase family protein subunit M [Candidatus Omnitrophota bacterium]
MDRFQFINANSAQEAVSLLNDGSTKSKIIAGGQDLLTELKEHIAKAEKLINISDVQELNYINAENGSLKVGATTTIAAIAANGEILAKNRALAEAASVVGSPQIRNQGTLGGNLCQRPRCWYYRSEAYPCLKKGGGICYALSGRNKYHAIFGGAPAYYVHPSDCATALTALGAIIHCLGPDGEKTIPSEKFFTLPSEILLPENVLKPNEMITAVEIPTHNMKSTYIKFREKESYDWAISAVAAALELDGTRCVKASIVLGGVAPKPWRAKKAEDVLQGKTITESLAEEAGEAAVDDATALSDNEYKIPLTKTLVKRAIMKLIA